MGKIKKILENELVGGTQNTDVYPVTSTKAVYNEDNERLDNILNRVESGIIYDVSLHNNGAVFKSLQALLSSSNLSDLIPTSVRRGGITIRFIQGSVPNSDNKYVQYRLMSNTFSTNKADWQGVDEEPTSGSDNLVKSGGVAEMGKELAKVTTISKIKITDLKFTQHDYAGIYCSNINTGGVSFANNVGNGIVIPVKEGDVFEIIGENLKYGTQSVQFYSGYPSSDTNIAKILIRSNKVTAPQGATYMLVSVNPSLGTETTIKQLNWVSMEDLPQSYKEVLENIGSEYKTQVINVEKGIASGNNNMFPISLLDEGDIIQIYVKSDIDTTMSLVTSYGYVIKYVKTNQIVTKEITANDITGRRAFGFYINSAQATQSGTLNCSLRIIKNSSAITLSKILLNVVDTTEEVKHKLNNFTPPLSKYELFSLGDSLSQAGIWQTKVAQLTGCIFDQAKNSKAGAMLSAGGTSSFGNTFDNVLWRTKNLIDQNYITDNGENTIVILENVNDGYQAFDGDAKTIVPTTPIEGYNDADFGVDLLNSISNKAVLNAVLRLNTVVAGRNLRIDTLPTKAGNITLKVGWAGSGISNYNIYVEPQATQEETLSYVLNRILEYSYTGITDVLGEDGRSVDFSSGNSNYLPTVQFTDTDNTGMTCTVTDNPNAKGSVARYFIGENVSEWTDLSKWQKGITYSQGWKSSIEMLQRTYPKLHIFVSMFPLHAVTASEYLLPNGTYDTAAYNKVHRMEIMRKMQVELNNIAKFYSLPFIDVFAECGIGISNMLTYYNAQANVHPKNEGYYKFGETVATQLKRFLI